MSSALLYQGLFLRLSARFTLPFLIAAAALLGFAFPPLARRAMASLPPLAAAIAVLAMLVAALVLSLWIAAAAYRLAPPRPAAWFRPPDGPPRDAATAAAGLGRYSRIGVILAGGGAKGAYQAGALAAIHGFLAERGALGNVRMLAGSSVGAWNACFWLAGMISDERDGPLERWWSELRLSEVVGPTWYLPWARNYVLSAAPWRRAFRTLFRDNAAAREHLETLMLHPDAPDSLRFYLTRTNVERAHLEFSTNRPDLVDVENVSGQRRPLEPPDRWTRARTLEDLEQAVFASMDIPPLFEYVRIGDEIFEDGGVVDNLPIYFGTGIEKCDLLFVLPLNASYASSVERRGILRRIQRVLTIRQGALERKALKDVYLYNELAALRGRVAAEARAREPSVARATAPPAAVDPAPAGSESALEESARRELDERAAGRVHRPVQIFAICPDEPLAIDTLEFWKTREAGRAFRLMREHTRYELERFDFDAAPNWIRVALVGPSGEVRYLEDF